MAIKIALAGNPNCGKTTLFNALTGSSQFTGNWPGVTVEKKEGNLKGDKDVTVMDLPGIYSLSPYTPEEVVARNYLIHEQPDVIFNIVDGTNLERNLYLSTQLAELGIPMLIAVNMMDMVEKTGDQIRTDKLSQRFGCEVAEISALKGTGIQKAVQKAVSLAQKHTTISLTHPFSPRVEQAIEETADLLKEDVRNGQKRFFAIKLLERDEKIGTLLHRAPDVSGQIRQLEEAFDDDVESIITNERYAFISSMIDECCIRKRGKETQTVSDRIDRIVTNRWLALPVFAAVMFLVYYVSVSTIGDILTGWTNDTLFGEWIIPGVTGVLQAAGCAAWLTSLIADGIVGGVGAVLGFVPQMLVLFLFLAFLEACGYMARVAFIMDRIFRKFGLSGKSFIPMLIGTGCGVPGIMASRNYGVAYDRKSKGSQNDDYDDDVCALRSKAADHRSDSGSLFLQRRMGFLERVFYRYRSDYLFWRHFKEDETVRGGSVSVCDGAAGLSSADSRQRIPKHVGTRLFIYQKSWYNYSAVHNCIMVFAGIWMGGRPIYDAGTRAAASEYVSRCRKRTGAGFCSAWLGRLEDGRCSGHRSDCKRKCCSDIRHFIWICRNRRIGRRDLERAGGIHVRGGGIFFSGI